jgi:hypothetical protein
MMFESLTKPAFSSVESVPAELELTLLRRFEPVLRFTQGEQFYPIDAERYVRRASLWVQRPGEAAVCLVDSAKLNLETLGEVDLEQPDAIYFLKFIDPLDATELAAYHARQREQTPAPTGDFHTGTGRLARVGYASRFVDALFNLALLARGRVPGDTAAAAAVAYAQMMARREAYHYHGRVVREAGWVVVQYWFFYVYNNWRSAFSGANDHEADWEMVSVYLAEETQETATGNGDLGRGAEQYRPEWVAYAKHDYSGDDLRRRWDDLELEKVGDHPVVYVAAGSHAAYFRSGEYLTELELPFLHPLAKIADHVQEFWHRNLRQYEGDGEQGQEQDYGQRSNIFRIPFVDYARGDGIAIGPGQDQSWVEPRLLRAEESWLSAYRGLWGLYARDPFAGEDAPAGPMYNRDRTIRRAWYDPVGWSGLDKVAPAHEELRLVLAQQLALAERQEELRTAIQQKSQQVRNLGAALRAMRNQPHLRRLYAGYAERLETLSAELAGEREELTADQALLASLDDYAVQLRAGVREPPRAHIRRAHTPTEDEQFRAGRLAEVWAAASIGLMLVVVVGLIYFARHYVLFGMAALVALFAFIEATFRGRVVRMVTSVTIGLAVISALVLLYEFFWPVIALSVVGIGSYLLWDNLRELWQ